MGYMHTLIRERYATTQCDWEKQIQLFHFFIVCPLLIIFFGFFAHWLTGHLLMAKNPYGSARNFSFVCLKSIWPYCATHSMCCGHFFFIMMIDRSIKSSEVLLFAHHHSMYNIEPCTHNRVSSLSLSPHSSLVHTHELYCVSLSWIKSFHFAIQPR